MDTRSEHMTFEQALQLLKAGYKVGRRGWNDKGMFLSLLPGGTIPLASYTDMLAEDWEVVK